MGWGARRWLDTGIFQVQPSEFAKLSFILAMANFLRPAQDELRSWSVFWKALAMTAGPFVLIMKEPDWIGVDFIAMGLTNALCGQGCPSGI